MTTFTDTFGFEGGGQSTRLTKANGGSWETDADEPPAGFATFATLSNGTPTASNANDQQSVGRIHTTGYISRTLVRFTLPEKPYNDELEILDCRIMIRFVHQNSPPTMALYEIANNVDLTEVSWWYVNATGTAYWYPSRASTHGGGSSTTQLQDSSGNFKDANLTGVGTTLGSKVLNTTDGCDGTISGLASNTVTSSLTLSNGTDDEFDAGDEYVIIGGGNPVIQTDYGYGANGIIDITAAAGSTTFTSWSLKNFFKNNKPEWGASYGFMIKAYDEGSLPVNAYGRNSFGATGYSLSYSKLELDYDNPKPKRPLIDVTPQDDGINANISFTDKYEGADTDLQSYVAVFKQAADPIYHASGVSSATYGVTLTDVGASVYTTSDLTSDGSDSYLKTDNTEYRLQFYAQDNQNTGSSTLAQVGNLISITRPGLGTSTVSNTTPAVGEEITLTINATGGMFGGKCKRFAVNWDSAVSDTDADYSFVELDSTATSTTITHRYSSGGLKTIKVQVEDELGWRSDREALASQPTVATPTPIASPKASRTEILNTDYNDSSSAFYITGQHSYPIGNNRTIAEYKYKTTGASQHMTSFALDNDNTVFENGSKLIKVKSTLASCEDTDIWVYGLVSKAWNSSTHESSNISDTAVTFSHYEWAKVELAPDSGVDTFGSASGEFFKRIDLIVVETLSPTDNFLNLGSRYTIATHDGSTAANNNLLINTQIRATKLSYMWGGSAVANPNNAQSGTSDVAPQNITVAVTSTNVITDTGDADFLSEGFAPGDYIIITGHDQAGNNGTFKIKNEHDAVTETVLKIDGTLTDDGSSTCQIIKDTSHLTSISCAANNAQTNTVKHRVKDDAGTISSEVETETVTVLTDSNRYWDLLASVSEGEIAILNTCLSRSGGVGGSMALGDKRYPVGVVQSKLGLPTYSMTLRTLKQNGFVKVWSLLEGGRYNWVVVDSDMVNSPFNAYKRLRIKCTGGNLQKDTSNAGQYVANLNFIVMGEHEA